MTKINGQLMIEVDPCVGSRKSVSTRGFAAALRKWELENGFIDPDMTPEERSRAGLRKALKADFRRK
jgi:hypothetical protein